MEISRNLLAVLLLLTVVVSGLGTWSMLSRDATYPAGSAYTVPDQSGRVALTVSDIPRGHGVVSIDITPAEVATNG